MKTQRIAALILVVLLLAQSPAFAEPPAPQAVAQREAMWLYSLQQPSGAIVMSREKTLQIKGRDYYRIDPYYANIAALGLLSVPSPASLAVVKNWIGWYLQHINTKDNNGNSGTIYNYLADTASAEEISSGQYEASCACAASFLVLLEKYSKTDGGKDYLKSNRATIEAVATALTAAVQPDGLTTARPGAAAKPLMDNCELYAGLSSIASLESKVFDDYRSARKYNEQKTALQKNILNSFWNKINQNFDLQPGVPASWTVFYPDCVAQMYPALCGVIDSSGSQAKTLYGQIGLSFPNWSTLQPDNAFACAVMASCAALNSDNVVLGVYLSTIRNNFISKNNPWPWINAEAGFTIIAAMAAQQNQQQPQNNDAAFTAGAVMLGVDMFAFGPRRW